MNSFMNISTGAEGVIFTGMKNFTDRSIELIDKLEIGNINILYQLGVYLKEEFKLSLDNFPDIVDEILDFEDYVKDDFSFLFKFDEIINDVQEKIENNYKNATGNIEKKINSTFSILE